MLFIAKANVGELSCNPVKNSVLPIMDPSPLADYVVPCLQCIRKYGLDSSVTVSDGIVAEALQLVLTQVLLQKKAYH